MPAGLERLRSLLAKDSSSKADRPFVTLSYAQSLDGSLTLFHGKPSPVSGNESMTITHQLRTFHDAILVGVGTVLADNPRLTARDVNGTNPQPIVLDSHLRTPPDARLFQHPKTLWIMTTADHHSSRRTALEQAGGRVSVLPGNVQGYVNLREALSAMHAEGIRSLMVEGGGQVITSFLRARLVDHVTITAAPVLAGGYSAVSDPLADHWSVLPRLEEVLVEQAGDDLLIWGLLP